MLIVKMSHFICPTVRMDRVKGTTDVFTLKSFADVINSLDFAKVIIYDAHSNVTPALIDRVENRPNTMFVERTLLDIGDDSLVMYYPDEGAMKRYSENCQRPYSFGMKRRNWETGKILGVDIINREIVKDKNILIVDDICSKGGTFCAGSKRRGRRGYLPLHHSLRGLYFQRQPTRKWLD